MNPFIIANISNLNKKYIIMIEKNIDFFKLILRVSIILIYDNVRPVMAIGIISEKYPNDSFIESLYLQKK